MEREREREKEKERKGGKGREGMASARESESDRRETTRRGRLSEICTKTPEKTFSPEVHTFGPRGVCACKKLRDKERKGNIASAQEAKTHACEGK